MCYNGRWPPVAEKEREKEEEGKKAMIVKGTCFRNDPEKPLVYGDVEIENVRRRRLRGEEEKEGRQGG